MFNTHYQPHYHPTTKSLWLCSSVYCRPPHQSRRIWLVAAATNQKDQTIMMTSWHGNSSGLLALCEGNHRWPVDCPRKGPVPSVTGRSPLQRASDAELWWFLLCKPEHTVTNMQWIWRSRIWDAWRPLWRRCYGTCQFVFSLWSRHLCARPDVYAVNRMPH